MRLHPLSFRVLLLSWAVALVTWPLVWTLLAAAQGVGAVLARGAWIGVAVPLGLHPMALINEPSVAFAGSQSALYLYWLAPSLLALAIAGAGPTLVPAPPGWVGELAVFHASFAAAALGLGWAPPLGETDGPAAGLLRFWSWRPGVFEAIAAGAGVVAVQFAVARLASHLWSEPGGPTRARRLVVMIAHGLAPALGWAAAVIATGWAVAPRSLLTTGAVLLGGLAGAWHWMPRSPLRQRTALRWRAVAVSVVLGVVASLIFLRAGAPGRGHGKAYLWGAEGLTSNVRPGMDVVRLTTRRVPRTPPAR